MPPSGCLALVFSDRGLPRLAAGFKGDEGVHLAEEFSVVGEGSFEDLNSPSVFVVGHFTR